MTYHDLFIGGIYFFCFTVLFEDKIDCLITF